MTAITMMLWTSSVAKQVGETSQSILSKLVEINFSHYHTKTLKSLVTKKAANFVCAMVRQTHLTTETLSAQPATSYGTSRHRYEG